MKGISMCAKKWNLLDYFPVGCSYKSSYKEVHYKIIMKKKKPNPLQIILKLVNYKKYSGQDFLWVLFLLFLHRYHEKSFLTKKFSVERYNQHKS